MIFKCPGQDDRNLKIEIIACSVCNYKFEIFSDEIKRHCPQCNNTAYRKKLPSCIDWCRSAKECTG